MSYKSINEETTNSVYSFELLPEIQAIEWSIANMDITDALIQLSTLRTLMERESLAYDVALEAHIREQIDWDNIPF